MAQNSCSGSLTLKVSRNGDTLSTILTADKLLQQFKVDGSNALTPDWTVAANQPVIHVRAMSNSTGEIIAGSNLTVTKWSFFGKDLTFNTSTGLCTAPAEYAGKFKSETKTVNGGIVPALRITGNVMAGMVGNTFISFSGQAKAEGSTVLTPIGADIPVAISTIQAGSYIGYINAGDGAVSKDFPTEIMRAILTQGGIEITAGVTYKWYKRNASAWTLIVGATASSYTANVDNVDGCETFKCEFIVAGQVVASDIADIVDVSDPYRIDYVLAPADFTEFTKTGTGSQLKITPKVKYGSVDDTARWKFTAMSLVGGDGNVLKAGTGAEQTSLTMTYADAIKSFGDPSFICDAVTR